MKYIVILTVCLMFLPICCEAQANADPGAKIMDELSVDKINNFISEINRELNEDIPILTYENIRQISKNGISWEKILQKVMSMLFKEITTNVHLMGKLLFLAVLCAIMQNLQTSFDSSAISMLAYSVCYIFLTVIALTAFYHALTAARVAVSNMVGFMQALLPLLITLLAGVGAITSATLFSPLMLFCVSSISIIVKDIVMPLLYLTAVLECVNYISGKYRLTNLSGFFKQSGMVMLGLLMVMFVGIISIQGVAGSISDGLTLRAAKYATSTFIPILGGMFADTVELVMGASLILKNAVGVFGVIVIMSICAIPLIKLMSLVIIMKATGSLVQPMGDEKMAKCLDGMGNTLLLIFSCVLTTALMFFVAITMIVGAGTMAMMLR